MTKKMAGYLGLASIFLCMVLMTACGGNSTSGSPSGPNGSKGSNATSAPTTPVGAIIAKKASTSAAQKATPTATPKPVVITMTPKPLPTMVVPTQVPTPVPTMPPVVPTPTTPPVVVSNPGVPAAAAAVLTLINQERASKNLSALKWSTGLQTSAHNHNVTMQAANTLSHQLPGEAAFGDRERAAGVSWWSAAENIGWASTGDPSQVACGINTSMFNETPPDDGHRLNILSSSSNVIGIDVLVDSTNHKIWLTEDFAQI